MITARRESLGILVLEDDVVDYRLFLRQLARSANAEHEVVHAFELRAAERLLQERAFDLVVADLHLPDASGEQVVRTLRKRCPDAPLILLTGNADERLARECVRAGAQDYLVKGHYDERRLALLIALAIERQAVVDHVAERERYERELRDTLISHVSHELRTPLAAIVQYTGILESGILGPVESAQQDALGVVQRNATSLQSMVEAMVESSRASAGTRRLNLQPIAPAALAREVVSDLKLAAMQAGVRLDLRLRGAPCSAALDAEAMRQVLRNLINNAVRHGGAGGRVRIVLAAGPQTSSWEIRVVDRGAGIAQADLKKLFERFFQVPSRDSSARRGLGLGLHIAQDLTATHGGTLTVRSKLGLGTVATVRLPQTAQGAPRALGAEA